MSYLPLMDLMKRIVPVTRFNRGEAKKIFEEVALEGPKIVMKNNTPLCVLISPDDYSRLLEGRDENGKSEGEKSEKDACK